MHGLHLTADLRDCPVDRGLMTEPAALRRVCMDAVLAAGLQPVGELFHRFTASAAVSASDVSESDVFAFDVSAAAASAPDVCARDVSAFGPHPSDSNAPMGITGVVLLAESHLAVHTWPELACATLDVYVCNFGADNSARAHAVLATLIAAFEPAHIERHALERGRVEVMP